MTRLLACPVRPNSARSITAQPYPSGTEAEAPAAFCDGSARPCRVTDRRRRAWGGVIGPAAFVTAWAANGAATKGYSPIDDAISRLAAVGTTTRPFMTAGFVGFGLSVPIYATALRRHLPGPAWLAALSTGIATLGVAAFPLDVSSRIDTVHGALATIGYATLAATPLLAARPLAESGYREAAALSLTAGLIAGLSLATTALGPAHGLFQRLGLTIGDLWLAASAVAILRGARLRTSTSPRPSAQASPGT
jgi:Protein of unknown function (DUF998)